MRYFYYERRMGNRRRLRFFGPLIGFGYLAYRFLGSMAIWILGTAVWIFIGFMWCVISLWVHARAKGAYEFDGS